MINFLRKSVYGLLVVLASAQAQAACPVGTLWEPYSESCAAVRDVQDEYLPALQVSTAAHSGAPVPGGMASGTAYATGQLVALDSGRLHTKMFVYPDGLEKDSPLPAWLYTTATSRVDNGLEILAMYGEDRESGYLGLYAWTCVADFPCPNGATTPAWQWSRPMPELTCNITHAVDQGGHAQKQLYYANHSDRIDSGSPPLWKSAVYLWNYCDEAWDLAWEHNYRQDKTDCSIQGAACAWWGPSIEIFGDTLYPQIAELGYEESLLYHDGNWSWLLPPETQFRDPTNPSWGSLTPWQLFHLEPNRSFGVGNWFNQNDAPVIEDQVDLEIEEGQAIAINASLLTISDADVDPAYHVSYKLTVYAGNNYTYSNGEVTPEPGFTGTLVVPISASDGAAESVTFNLLISVGLDVRVPVIQGQYPLQTVENQPITITIDDLIVSYPGGNLADLSVRVLDGESYERVGNTVTPDPGFVGVLKVNVFVRDSELQSDTFELLVQVVTDNVPPDIVPPEIVLVGSATITLSVGNPYSDAGATAVDNIDGDISHRIVVDNPVDTGRVGSYTVTYSVEDLSGNVAVATRTVIVQSAEPVKRNSGGGALSILALVALAIIVLLSRFAR